MDPEVISNDALSQAIDAEESSESMTGPISAESWNAHVQSLHPCRRSIREAEQYPRDGLSCVSGSCVLEKYAPAE